MTTTTLTFYRTAIGKKVVMAVTGFIVFGFVAVHMLGNLQLFLGPERLNKYAEFLQGLGGVLWVFRGVVLLAVVLHIWSAAAVTLQNWAARPQGYAVTRYRETDYAARTMWWGGPIIALFVIYHLLHFTTGDVHPAAAAFDKAQVFNNVVTGFQVWWSSAIYIVACFLVALHLYHGVWSMLQTVGAAHPKYNRWRKVFSVAFAVMVGAGNISMPVAVLAGWIQPVL
jgi:succinate dehydrogenase / fumarate reductase cytochrome b subunit